MNEVKTLAKQTVIYGLGTIVPRFLNYAILTFMYTRLFSTAEYGVVTELYAWMVFLLIVLTYGMETGFFRFSQQSEDNERVYSTSLLSLFVTSTLFSVLVFAFIKPVSAFMNYSNNPDYIKMFALILSIDAFTAIPFAKLRKDNRALLFSVIKIINVVITIIAVFFFLFWGKELYEKSSGWFHRIYNPNYGVGYVFLANLIGSVSSLIMLLPTIVKIKPVFDSAILKKMLYYSIPLAIAGLAGSINDALDKVLLRRMVGGDEGLSVVGEYGAGYKLAVLMSLVIQMYRFAAEPFFFERAKRANAKESYAFIMKYFVIVMLFCYLGINLYISLFQYFLGPQFRSSIVIVPIVSMAYLLYGIYVNHSIWYKLKDYTHFGIYIVCVGAVVTIIINLLFIPRYGYMASAVAHVASYLVMLIISFVFARNRYYIEYNFKALIPYFVIAMAMTALSLTMNFANLLVEVGVNTLLLLAFVGYAEYKDRLLSVIFGRGEK